MLKEQYIATNMTTETKIFALREHYLNTITKDYIVIRSPDDIIYIKIPKEQIEEALNEFKTGEELNINF